MTFERRFLIIKHLVRQLTFANKEKADLISFFTFKHLGVPLGNTRVGLSARHPQSHHLLARICNPCYFQGTYCKTAPTAGGAFVADRECLYPSRIATSSGCGWVWGVAVFRGVCKKDKHLKGF